MIDLNPLVEERHPIKPPPNASAEEYHCQWYSLTDRVEYLPGGLMAGKVSYNVCFHDLERGLQTHCYAPMGLNIKGKWSLGGSLPGEPIAPVELGLGAPLQGLYLREDVDMKCNIMMTGFVKKTLKKAHSALVDRLLVKAQIVDASLTNRRISEKAFNTHLTTQSQFSDSQANTLYSPSDYGDSPIGVEAPQIPPLRNLGFRGPDSADYDSALYPQALKVRNSVSSYHSSIGGSESGRVSWQNLNANRSRSPSVHQHIAAPGQSPSTHQMDPIYQQANPYRTSPQSQHTRLASIDDRDIRSEEPRAHFRPAAYQSPPPQHGTAELEG